MIFGYFRVVKQSRAIRNRKNFRIYYFYSLISVYVQKHALLHFNFTPLSFVSAAVSARARTDPIILPSDKNDCR